MTCSSCNVEIQLGPTIQHHVIDFDVFVQKRRRVFCNKCFSTIEWYIELWFTDYKGVPYAIQEQETIR